MNNQRRAIIIVDHGSRLAESNALLEAVVQAFAVRFADQYEIVEPAHMELAEPSIRTAYDRAVARGATDIIVCPFFLAPGKHWTHDIPALAHEAAAAHPHTIHRVAPPLGNDPLMLELMQKRIEE